MGHIYYKQLVEGVNIPAIIHNSSYFLIQMGVYENGTVSCWHKSDLEQFRNDLKRGWVVSQIPADTELSVHSLGSFPVREANWRYTTEEFYLYVVKVIQSLNPEMENLYHTTQREQDKWDKARVCWSASPVSCKLKSGFGYHLINGESNYIFYRKEGRLYLTSLTVYRDKTIQIEAEKERIYTPEEIAELLEQNILSTSPNGEEWVTIEGLGELLLAPSSYGGLPAKEKLKEIFDDVARLSGDSDSIDRCRKAHYQYLCEPSAWSLEKLREAYEAVPEHQRMFLGDMDTKDHDFIRILYHPERKREV